MRHRAEIGIAIGASTPRALHFAVKRGSPSHDDKANKGRNSVRVVRRPQLVVLRPRPSVPPSTARCPALKYDCSACVTRGFESKHCLSSSSSSSSPSFGVCLEQPLIVRLFKQTTKRRNQSLRTESSSMFSSPLRILCQSGLSDSLTCSQNRIFLGGYFL